MNDKIDKQEIKERATFEATVITKLEGIEEDVGALKTKVGTLEIDSAVITTKVKQWSTLIALIVSGVIGFAFVLFQGVAKFLGGP